MFSLNISALVDHAILTVNSPWQRWVHLNRNINFYRILHILINCCKIELLVDQVYYSGNYLRQVLRVGWSSLDSVGSSMNFVELQNRFNKSSLKFNGLQMNLLFMFEFGGSSLNSVELYWTPLNFRLTTSSLTEFNRSSTVVQQSSSKLKKLCWTPLNLILVQRN